MLTAAVSQAATKPPVETGLKTADCVAIANVTGFRGRARQKVLDACAQRVQDKLVAECSKLRQGGDAQRWRTRNACKIWAVWPGSDSTKRAAVTVAFCEGGTDPRAENGQYWGTFQMGTDERATYGHGTDVVSQTIAASKYHDVAGGFGPWGCKPGSEANTDKWKEASPGVRRFGK